MAWCRQAKTVTRASVDQDLCLHMASRGNSFVLAGNAADELENIQDIYH